MFITTILGDVRNGSYIERDASALDEMLTYEQSPSGTYSAIPGKHDDILITRAIALHIADSDPIPVALPELPHSCSW